MKASAKALSESHDVSTKVAQMLQTRTKAAMQRYGERMRRAGERSATALVAECTGRAVGPVDERRALRRRLRAALDPAPGTRCASAATTSSSTSGRACRRCCASSTKS
jgi:hypothetical protein